MPSCLQAKKKLLLFSVVTQCTTVLCRPEAFCVESWKLYKNSGVLFAASALRLTDGCRRWKIPSRGMACKNIDDHQTRGWWKQVNWKRRLAQKWTDSSDEVARTTKSREAFSPEQGPTKAEFLKVYLKRRSWLYHIYQHIHLRLPSSNLPIFFIIFFCVSLSKKWRLFLHRDKITFHLR